MTILGLYCMAKVNKTIEINAGKIINSYTQGLNLN
jgi:hypothetical protein